ncbi:somatostatin [Clupea harengus]|uniref:Somatostatin n=1 Tax=Clupea harengus TaxID=7950 RepID=A0A6P8GRD6_CLUHA|nr:somatostatin [Clupea harengus]
MLCSQLQLLLVSLCTSALLGRISAAPQRDILDQFLRNNGNIKDTNVSEDVSEMLRLKILADLMAEGDDDNLLPDRGPQGGRDQVPRQLPNSQRERKAGCRNFYWKTFTSC